MASEVLNREIQNKRRNDEKTYMLEDCVVYFLKLKPNIQKAAEITKNDII